MKTFEYTDIARDLKYKFGLEANFAGCNTVAWCANELVKIMTRAGFKVIDKCKEHLSYIDGDIYHGNIDYLKKII